MIYGPGFFVYWSIKSPAPMKAKYLLLGLSLFALIFSCRKDPKVFVHIGKGAMVVAKNKKQLYQAAATGSLGGVLTALGIKELAQPENGTVLVLSEAELRAMYPEYDPSRKEPLILYNQQVLERPVQPRTSSDGFTTTTEIRQRQLSRELSLKNPPARSDSPGNGLSATEFRLPEGTRPIMPGDLQQAKKDLVLKAAQSGVVGVQPQTWEAIRRAANAKSGIR